MFPDKSMVHPPMRFARCSNNLIHQIEVNCNGPWFKWTNRRRKNRSRCSSGISVFFIGLLLSYHVGFGAGHSRFWVLQIFETETNFASVHPATSVLFNRVSFFFNLLLNCDTTNIILGRERERKRGCHTATILLQRLSNQLHCLCLQNIA